MEEERKEASCEAEAHRTPGKELENLTKAINRTAAALEALVRVNQRALEESLEKKFGITTTH